MFIVDFYNYLKSPSAALNIDQDQDRNIKRKISIVSYGYLFYMLLAFISFCIVKIIDVVILKNFYNYSILSQSEVNSQKLLAHFGEYIIIVVPLIIPFIEEILFRLPLNLKRISVGLSEALIAYRFSGNHLFTFEPNEMYSYLRIGIALTIFVSVILFFPLSWLKKIKEDYFKHFFYLSAVLFALGHISNLAPYNHNVLFFYPLYTLPQFFMGLIIGYVRVRQGFFTGWILHALINLPAALLYYFK